MKILDPGHIYRINFFIETTGYLKFVKRSGGAITYKKQWPGIQTQAVMRALIDFMDHMADDKDGESKDYFLWQLGCDTPQRLTLHGISDSQDVLSILIDRSKYLNVIISCIETSDAIYWLESARSVLGDPEYNYLERLEEAIRDIRLALWSYEVRAYRRKQESVNREKPQHDDTARPRFWRDQSFDDVPFNHERIEERVIGEDGHIVI